MSLTKVGVLRREGWVKVIFNVMFFLLENSLSGVVSFLSVGADLFLVQCNAVHNRHIPPF